MRAARRKPVKLALHREQRMATGNTAWQLYCHSDGALFSSFRLRKRYYKATQPLPCPFCGALPGFVVGRALTFIRCENKECAVQPDCDAETQGDIASAVERWNRRAT